MTALIDELSVRPRRGQKPDWSRVPAVIATVTFDDIDGIENEFQALIDYSKLHGEHDDPAYLAQVHQILQEDAEAISALIETASGHEFFEMSKGGRFTARGPAQPRGPEQWSSPYGRVSRLLGAGVLLMIGYEQIPG